MSSTNSRMTLVNIATKESWRRDERGAASFEFLMLLPLLVFVILFLIGMGHTLINKHHVQLGARFAAQYHSVYGSPPPVSRVQSAVATKEVRWRVFRNGGSNSDPSGIIGGTGDDGSGVFGVFSSLMNALSGDKRLAYFATTQPTRGAIPRFYPSIGRAEARYVMEYDPWTCENARGSYMGILVSRLPFGSIGPVRRAMDSLACCRNYKSSDVHH